MIRVVLVDDQTLFREGLATMLSVQEDIEVVGEAENGRQAVDRVATLRPDVVLMDLRMPEMGGVAATREIRTQGQAPPILVLTTFDDDDDVFDALRAGAAGYLLKDSPSERLVEAIRAVARGESFLQPSITAKVLAELQRVERPRTPADISSFEGLTERELDVLRLLAQGLPNKSIASRLHLADGTVKNHVTNILSKLEVGDRTQAALKARDLGLV